jgi:hypothetical protein
MDVEGKAGEILPKPPEYKISWFWVSGKCFLVVEKILR